MELINTRNGKKTFVQDSDIVYGLYHFLYKLDNTLSEEKQKEQKKYISKLKYQIALYDIKSDNLYLIEKEDVYNKVFHENYRFITKKYLKEFVEKRQELIEHKYKNHPFKNNHENKYNYFIAFLNNFDLEVYFNTYIEVLYNIDTKGEELTLKERPSYAPMKVLNHITPYYKRSEIIYYGLNNNIINSPIVSNDEINKIYNELKNYEFSFNLLLDHYNYIVENDAFELIQYYSLQSYKTINGYLRFSEKKDNYLLNKLINKVNNIIYNVNKNSSKFNNDFYVYRFVEDDSYIKNLDINDIFIEKGFLSTTRDPFYKKKSDSSFGWTLLKIKVPKDYYFLCIETVSMIPYEEEVIFPTNTKLKLINRDYNCDYYHTDPSVQKKIKTKYEFEIIKDDEQIKILDEKQTEIKDNFNFREIEGYIVKSDTLYGYEDFYVYKNNDGFVLYCFNNINLLVIIEIYNNTAYINYTFQDKGKISYIFEYFKSFDEFADFIDFINQKYKLNILKIDLAGGYINCNKKKSINYYYKGGIFCYEIYYYLGFKDNSFYLNSRFIVPNIEFGEFKKLYNIKVSDVIQRIDNTGRYTEIFYLLNNIYLKQNNKDNIIDFYLYLVENCCYFIEILKSMIQEYVENREIKINMNIFKKLFFIIDYEGFKNKRSGN